MSNHKKMTAREKVVYALDLEANGENGAYLAFKPYSWYMGWTITKENEPNSDTPRTIWRAYTNNGNTYTVLEEAAYSLRLLKERIKERETSRREK